MEPVRDGSLEDNQQPGLQFVWLDDHNAFVSPAGSQHVDANQTQDPESAAIDAGETAIQLLLLDPADRQEVIEVDETHSERTETANTSWSTEEAHWSAFEQWADPWLILS